MADWDPAPPAEVAELFAACPASWWLAGGYAIEAFAGRAIRAHGDIDVLMLRRDQLAVQHVLAGWQWWAADPPGTLRPWAPGETLPAAVHDIWCRPSATTPWRIQVMLDCSEGDEWVSRRSPSIRWPIATLGHHTADGVPFLAPEIQLFYKAKAPRDKDQTDFSAVLPLLTSERRRWLAGAIERCHSAGHPWLARLAPQGAS